MNTGTVARALTGGASKVTANLARKQPMGNPQSEFSPEKYAAKFRRVYDYLSSNQLLGLESDLQIPRKGEIPIVLTEGIKRFLHAYSSQIILPLLTMVGDRSAILYGEPGTGKTTVVLLLSSVMGVDPPRAFDGVIVGNAEFSEGVFGHIDMKQYIENKQYEVEWSEFAKSPIKFVDELSRISGYGQALLGSVLSERKIGYQGKYFSIPDGPFFGAANALNLGETFGLTPHIKSRFNISVLTLGKEYRFSSFGGDVTKPKDYPQTDVMTLTKAENQAFREHLTRIRREPWVRDVEKKILAVIQSSQIVPKEIAEQFSCAPGMTKYRLFQSGTIESLAGEWQSEQHSKSAASLKRFPQLHFNECLSDRERQSWLWYTVALSVILSPHSPDEMADSVAQSILPFILFMNITPNTIARDANQDKTIYDKMQWTVQIGQKLWDYATVTNRLGQISSRALDDSKDLAFEYHLDTISSDVSFAHVDELDDYIDRHPLLPLPNRLYLISNMMTRSMDMEPSDQKTMIAMFDYYSTFVRNPDAMVFSVKHPDETMELARYLEVQNIGQNPLLKILQELSLQAPELSLSIPQFFAILHLIKWQLLGAVKLVKSQIQDINQEMKTMKETDQQILKRLFAIQDFAIVANETSMSHLNLTSGYSHILGAEYQESISRAFVEKGQAWVNFMASDILAITLPNRAEISLVSLATKKIQRVLTNPDSPIVKVVHDSGAWIGFVKENAQMGFLNKSDFTKLIDIPSHGLDQSIAQVESFFLSERSVLLQLDLTIVVLDLDESLADPNARILNKVNPFKNKFTSAMTSEKQFLLCVGDKSLKILRGSDLIRGADAVVKEIELDESLLSFSLDLQGRHMALVSKKNELKIIDLNKLIEDRTDALRFQHAFEQSFLHRIVVVEFTPNGKTLILGALNGTLHFVDLQSATIQNSIDKGKRGHDKAISKLVFSSCGKYMASIAKDNQLIVTNLESATVKFVVHTENGGHIGQMNDLIFSPDGTHVLTAGEDGRILIIDAIQGKIVSDLSHEQHGHTGPVLGLCFSGNGDVLISTGKDGLVTQIKLERAWAK